MKEMFLSVIILSGKTFGRIVLTNSCNVKFSSNETFTDRRCHLRFVINVIVCIVQDKTADSNTFVSADYH